jgi:hypothetical protein
MDNEEMGPSRWYYALAMLLFIAGWVGFGVTLFKGLWGMEGKLQQVVVPGRTEITLRDKGTYTIFYEYNSVVGNKIYSTGKDLSGLECTVISKATGARIPLVAATMSGTYELGSRAGKSVFEFNIPNAGLYELSAAYPEGSSGPEVVLAIGHDFATGMLSTIFGSLAIVFGSMFASAAIAGVTAFKRYKAKKQIRVDAVPPPHTYTPGATR